MRLSDLQTGEKAVVVKVLGHGNFRKRIIEMGFIKGKKIEVLLNAPLKDPIKYKVMDYEVSLRRNEALLIEVISEKEALETAATSNYFGTVEPTELHTIANKKRKIINVALVGNPNAGKTSFFNIASGGHERVGNYSGITVDAKEGHFTLGDYKFRIFDLPGTYSLAAYSPEERYVRKHIFEETPDVIINIVSASNLERNLYLTTQLIDMDVPMVIALNMYDELEKHNHTLNYQQLGKMIGVPIVPTVAIKGYNDEKNGLKHVFEKVIEVYEGNEPTVRHIHINHGGDLQVAIDTLNDIIKNAPDFKSHIAARFFAVKLLEKDKEAEKYIRSLSNAETIMEYVEKTIPFLEHELKDDSESAIINAKYGFIAGALAETYTEGKLDAFHLTKTLDPLVTHRFLGYPIFLLFMWVMFQATFTLGAYPQDWIDMGMGALADWVANLLPDGAVQDLLVDGIIRGIGSVIIFLPNILILYFFISLMEDSGYLSRAAFIMDKIMHKMGLHGKSFVPLLMGFGCNVPAILATRTIESKNSRMITMLATPFMSCSARLPVYVLFAGAFFPNSASLVMLSLYIIGMLMAIISARLFKRFLFNTEDVPFVMELPPYRMPTARATLRHMWEKSQQYLRKMGTIILFASIIIWALGYFPLADTRTPQLDAKIEQLAAAPELADTQAQLQELQWERNIQQQKTSYIGKIGNTILPAIEPLGFNWEMGIGLVAGLPAKELVVSTLGVLYTNNAVDETSTELSYKLQHVSNASGKPQITPLIAFGYMIFILLSFPCIATIIAIKNESGSWKWGLFSILYSTSLAWISSFLIFQIGSLW
jgi:ferrous iron transport protein B